MMKLSAILKTIGIIILVAGVSILTFSLYSQSPAAGTTRTFSTYTLLTSSWEKYKEEFINQDGRVIDYSRNSVTTSEGQSYALLRAVWVDDKETFDQVWKWTRENLKRPNDNLFGWQWGERENNQFGFITNGGENSASDADSDIALALILAGRRWNDQQYIESSRIILSDIWKYETATANEKRYLTAGNWATTENEIVINPSYFAPYAYRIFASVDPERDWMSLVSPGYDLLTRAGNEKLDKEKGVGLPPDWIIIERKTDILKAANLPNFTTNYSYDALRTPWRVAVDYTWNKNEEARTYLANCCQTLTDSYLNEGKLFDTYSHDGKSMSTIESASMYAASLPYFMQQNPELAKKIYEEKIIKLYSNDTNSFNENVPYYEQNWLWFGAAFYNDFIQPFN